MIDGLKPYGEYSESDQVWLGRIPKHWTLLPNRAVFEEIKQRNCSDEQMLSVTITRGVIQQRALLANSSKKDSSRKDKSAYKLVCPGDIAYNKMRAWQGSIGVSDLRGIISPAYVVIRLRKENNPRYFHHIFRTPAFAKEAERWSYGITSDMWSLRPEHFKMIYSPLPPPDEQAAIVRFLDHANQRIDRFIRTKKKVIALLNEQKQAIIHRAVTRGIDPDVKLKDSGIPWLGEIPEHWEVRKIKHLTETIGGMTPNKSQEKYWNGNIPWVSPKDMKVREIFDSKDHISESALHQTGISLINPPAVLIVVRGMILARTFPTAISMVVITINQDMKAILMKSKLNPEFFVSLLTGVKKEILGLVELAGHGTCCLRTDSWNAFEIPLPPVGEQSEIIDFLKRQLIGQNSLLQRTEREIDLIREYRTRLIADVVTGKVDVREAARNLPATSEEIPLEPDTEDLDEESELEPEPTEAAA